MAAPQQAPLPEPPAPGHLLPEPGFPDADPTQVGAWAGGTWPCTWVLGDGVGSAVLGALLHQNCAQRTTFSLRFIAPTCLPPRSCPRASRPMHQSASPRPSSSCRGAFPSRAAG